jgi:CRP-like cAMP-binding protein
LGQVFLDCLIERVHHIHDRVRQMAAERAEQRLARALLLLAEKFGRLEEDHLHLALPLSRQDLAQFIGATFETVSRICSDWERRGYIRTGRKQMSLLDEAAIRELAGANSSLV